HRRPQHQDDVVQDGVDFGVTFGCYKLVSELDGVLASGHLGGMQASVQVNDGLALASERPGVLIFQSTSKREAARRVFVAIEPGEVLWRRDDRDFPIKPASSSADGNQLDAI